MDDECLSKMACKKTGAWTPCDQGCGDVIDKDTHAALEWAKAKCKAMQDAQFSGDQEVRVPWKIFARLVKYASGGTRR